MKFCCIKNYAVFFCLFLCSADSMADENGNGTMAAATTTTTRHRDIRVHFVNDGRGRIDDWWPSTAADVAATLLTVAIAWYLLCANLDGGLMSVPGGSVASLFVLYAAGLAGGRLMSAIGGLPPLLGMMVAGIVLQNCGLYTVTDRWCVHLVSVMRCA